MACTAGASETPAAARNVKRRELRRFTPVACSLNNAPSEITEGAPERRFSNCSSCKRTDCNDKRLQRRSGTRICPRLRGSCDSSFGDSFSIAPDERIALCRPYHGTESSTFVAYDRKACRCGWCRDRDHPILPAPRPARDTDARRRNSALRLRRSSTTSLHQAGAGRGVHPRRDQGAYGPGLRRGPCARSRTCTSEGEGARRKDRRASAGSRRIAPPGETMWIGKRRTMSDPHVIRSVRRGKTTAGTKNGDPDLRRSMPGRRECRAELGGL